MQKAYGLKLILIVLLILLAEICFSFQTCQGEMIYIYIFYIREFPDQLVRTSTNLMGEPFDPTTICHRETIIYFILVLKILNSEVSMEIV